MVDRADEKARLRAELTERLRALSPEERARRAVLASQTLVRLLGDHLPAGAAVALFAPTPTELSCEPAIEQLSMRHPLAWPRVDGADLRFHLAPFDALRAAGSKMREPPPDAPGVTPLAVVVPARAFDRHGTRLGRGGGFYDRALASLPPETLLVGFVHAFQVVDELPKEPHDQAVHFVVTDEGGPLRCRPPTAPPPVHQRPPG